MAKRHPTKVREIPGVYKVYDDLLSPEYQDYIENTLKDTPNMEIQRVFS